MVSRCFSLLFMILLSPLFLIVSLLIYVDDGSPVLYRQKRIGINNTIFWIYKFRTMRKNIPEIPTHLVKDPEKLYTNIGPFLRRLSFDEIPQLLNIIKGEMVFIGPRPALYNQADLIELRTQINVHTLIPGITGWAQVNGRDELSIAEKVKLDEFYLKNRSLFLDIKIVLQTLLKVFWMHGVSH